MGVRRMRAAARSFALTRRGTGFLIAALDHVRARPDPVGASAAVRHGSAARARPARGHLRGHRALARADRAQHLAADHRSGPVGPRATDRHQHVVGPVPRGGVDRSSAVRRGGGGQRRAPGARSRAGPPTRSCRRRTRCPPRRAAPTPSDRWASGSWIRSAWWSATATSARPTQLTVLPRRYDLPPIRPSGSDEDGATRPAPQQVGIGEDDIIARSYLPGDALKRLHWKATARRGELMVRQEEQQMNPRAAVVIDLDAWSHGTDRDRTGAWEYSPTLRVDGGGRGVGHHPPGRAPDSSCRSARRTVPWAPS